MASPVTPTATPYRLRLVLPALLCLFTFVGVGGLLLERLSTSREDCRAAARRSLTIGMYQLANTISDLMPREMTEQTDRSVVDASLDSAIDLLVVADDNGKVLFSSRRELRGTPLEQVSGFDGTRAGLLQSRTESCVIDETGPLLRGYFPVDVGIRRGELRTPRSGILFVQYDMSTSLSKARSAALHQALRACILWLCCAVILSLALHHFITRRVERLSAVMATVATGDLGARASIRGSDEIACLAQSFDTMAEQLAAKQQALQLARFAMDHAGDAIYWMREDATLIDANEAACRLLGYTLEELLTLSVPDVDADYSRDVWPRHWEELRREGSLTFQSHQKAKDGRLIDVEITANLIRFHQVELNCAFVRDLTERKRAEEQQRRLENELQHGRKLESLGRLAGGVAHDMNNVLGAVLGLATSLKETHAGDPSLVGSLTTIERAACRGRDLVKGLTEFARKELERVQALDLNDLVRKEMALFERTTLQKVDVKLDLQDPLPRIDGESTSLASALMNLCVNALDAMPEGGTLTIRTRRLEDARVELAVEDTGQGMDEEVQGRALEPFFTTKPAGRGTGLGLAMVYGTVQAHGGSMHLTSQVGRGTTVALILPCSLEPGVEAAQTTETAQATEAPTAQQGLAPLRVLLVDDDELIREAIPAMLRFLGHQVDTVPSGPAALDRLEEGALVDLIILDQNMPVMTGIQALPQILALRPTQRILIATGYQDDTVEEALARTPTVGVIMKPFRLDELRLRLEQVMNENGSSSRP